MSFTFPQKIMFKHCDPAGIVFFPRYFEMINDCIETFFDEVIGLPYEEIHPTAGVPTAAIQAQFKAPSRHGDRIALVLECTKLGSSSLSLQITATSQEGELRFVAGSTLVYVNDKGRPTKWPSHIKDKLTNELKGPS